MSRLPLRIAPEADEPIVGFILRLADRNCIQNSRWLAEAAGITSRSITGVATNRFDLARLSTMSGVPESSLVRMAYWPLCETERIKFLDHQIGARMMTLQGRRVCPLCMAAAPYHRAAWDLAITTACPIHMVRLRHNCVECGKQLRWYGGPIYRCRCGADLRTAAVERLSQREIAASDHIHRVLSLPTGGRVQTVSSDQPLGRMGAAETLALLRHLAWFAGGGAFHRRVKELSPIRPDLHGWIIAGYEACLDWPYSFHRYLNTIRVDAPGYPGRYRLAKRFEAFSAWALDREMWECLAELLRRGVDSYLVRPNSET